MKTNIAVLENNYFAVVLRESAGSGGLQFFFCFLHRNDQNDAEVFMVPCAEIAFTADNTVELLLCFDCTHTHTHTSMHTHTHTHSLTLKHMQSCIHAHTQTHTHTPMHTLPHTRMHTHAYMHTHTHTHTTHKQKYMEK